MRRLLFSFMWFVVFVILLLAVDQVFLHSPKFKQPFLRDLQEFHTGFRRRLFGLTQPQPRAVSSNKSRTPGEVSRRSNAAAIDSLVQREIRKSEVEERVNGAVAQPDGVSYIYVDAQRNLQFAAGMEEIPPPLRATARPVKD